MLPCQSQCPSYHSGCHKSCACWKAFQERQRLQRQAKKKYLKFYGALCAQSLRQLTAGQSRRPSQPDDGEGPSLPCFTCGACRCRCT